MPAATGNNLRNILPRTPILSSPTVCAPNALKKPSAIDSFFVIIDLLTRPGEFFLSKINKALIKPLVFLVILAALVLIMRSLGIGHLLANLRSWIQGLGFWGPFVFSAIFAVSAIVVIPGSALSIMAGALFGSFLGVVVVSVGSTLGAGLAFLVARYVARNTVEKWLQNNEKFKKLDDLVAKQGPVIVAITRLVPLFPYNLLNYGFGLTKIKFSTYLFWSWLCMLPGTVLYVAGSDVIFRSVSEKKLPWEAIVLFAVFVVLLLLLIKYTRNFLKENEI